ncbi:MAG: tripartite tricarboxylate transporter TctB family protein [Paracoccaceae bacterium]|nr:tripartite tricarboxylate transporter TctB family protein [Paracoccaceae bacterium]
MIEEDAPANRLESLVLTLIFSLIAVALLALIGQATRWGPANGGWWTRPALAPGIALLGLVFANLVTLWRELADLRANPSTPAERADARDRIAGWLKPLEFLGYFSGYLWALPHLGYFLSTLGFILLLMVRVRLTSRKWLMTGVLAALALTGVFRMGLNVWMPVPEFYGWFPDTLRHTLTRWF